MGCASGTGRSRRPVPDIRRHYQTRSPCR